MPAIVSYREIPDGPVVSRWFDYYGESAGSVADLIHGTAHELQWRYVDSEYNVLLADCEYDRMLDNWDTAVDNWLWYGRVLQEYLSNMVQGGYVPVLTTLYDMVSYLSIDGNHVS